MYQDSCKSVVKLLSTIGKSNNQTPNLIAVVANLLAAKIVLLIFYLGCRSMAGFRGFDFVKSAYAFLSAVVVRFFCSNTIHKTTPVSISPTAMISACVTSIPRKSILLFTLIFSIRNRSRPLNTR